MTALNIASLSPEVQAYIASLEAKASANVRAITLKVTAKKEDGSGTDGAFLHAARHDPSAHSRPTHPRLALSLGGPFRVPSSPLTIPSTAHGPARGLAVVCITILPLLPASL